MQAAMGPGLGGKESGEEHTPSCYPTEDTAVAMAGRAQVAGGPTLSGKCEAEAAAGKEREAGSRGTGGIVGTAGTAGENGK